MKFVAVSDFLPAVRRLINIPFVPLLEDAIVESARTFCRESQMIYISRSFDFVMKEQQISVVSSSSENRISSNSVKASNIHSVTATDSSGDKVLLEPEVDYHQISRDRLAFLVDCKNVSVISIVEPSNGATKLPQILFEDYVRDIAHGAVAILYAQPDVDWSSPDRSNYYERLFVEGYREALRFRLESSPHLTKPVNPVYKREFF